MHACGAWWLFLCVCVCVYMRSVFRMSATQLLLHPFMLPPPEVAPRHDGRLRAASSNVRQPRADLEVALKERISNRREETKKELKALEAQSLTVSTSSGSAGSSGGGGIGGKGMVGAAGVTRGAHV